MARSPFIRICRCFLRAKAGWSAVPSCTRITADFPRNIAYNALRVGSRLFCLRAHTDPVILRMAEDCGWTVVDVKQGYANCSAAPVGTDALITADPSIASAARGQGLDVLRIAPGHIRYQSAACTYSALLPPTRTAPASRRFWISTA